MDNHNKIYWRLIFAKLAKQWELRKVNQLLDVPTPKTMKIVTSFYDQSTDTQVKKIILR